MDKCFATNHIQNPEQQLYGRTMKWTFTLIFISLIAANSIANPQVPDFLIYNNDTIPIDNLLVEKYLQTTKDDKERLLSFRNSIKGTEGTLPNCLRGYQAIYKIENDSLFVSSIIGCHALHNKIQVRKNYIKMLFKGKVKNEKVFIDWYSGNISFPSKSKDNKMLRSDRPLETVFLYETFVITKKGEILEIIDKQNYIDLESGVDRMEKDSIPDILFNQIKNHKWTKQDKFDCGEAYTVVIGKKGKITDVLMTNYQTEEQIEANWGNTSKEYDHCVKSINKALSKLRFDILKRKGEPIEEKVYIEIWFNDNGTIENWTDQKTGAN
ncbi:hypothetical protein [Flagellimonas sp.]|uniref:hypothetical protein n=1 Tax=Flagellimonas sp. TaxID=2058762 RepID=UPI003F4A6811